MSSSEGHILARIPIFNLNYKETLFPLTNFSVKNTQLRHYDKVSIIAKILVKENIVTNNR